MRTAVRRSPIVLGAAALLGVALALGAPATAAPPVVLTSTPPPPGGTNAVGWGITPNNDNAQPGDRIPATIKRSWTAMTPLCPEAATSDAVSTSVVGATTVVVENGYQCSSLSAYETATGKLRWRVPYHFMFTAYASRSKVYLVHDSATGDAIDAIDLASGRLVWTALTNGYGIGRQGNNRVSAAEGLVVHNTWVLDAATGKRRFTLDNSPFEATGGQVLIAGGSIFLNGDHRVRAYTSTGRLLWSHFKSTDAYAAGNGNGMPQYAAGRLYLVNPGMGDTLVLDAVTGARIRTLPRSDVPLAIAGSTGVVVQQNHVDPTTVRAVDLTTGAVRWTRTLSVSTQPLALWDSAPVISNGLVWFLGTIDSGTPGKLVALDLATGAVRSVTYQSCPASSGAITIAQGRIFTPSSCGVQTFVPR